MKPHELLGRTFNCECGRSHEVPTRKLVYAEDALEQLSEVLRTLVEGRSAVLVADERTWGIAGQAAEMTLEQASWSVRPIIVPDVGSGSPECNDTTHDWLGEQFAPADIALAVGSGVINDLTKWSAFEHDLPYAVIATAATMNGFTAANVAPVIAGVKTLIAARPPLAVFAVPSVLVWAPFELTAAGLGDAIAKPVSTADWLLNHIFCDEYFCRYCSEIINAVERCYLDHPEDIKKLEPVAIEALFNGLLYSGIAMTIVGTSAPASGGEHLLSHTLDMMSGNDGVAHDLHGRQVGIGTIFASALYDYIFQIENPRCHRLPADIDATFWHSRAGNVRDQYEQKKPALRSIGERLEDRETWRTFVDAARGQVRPPGRIKSCLKSAGAAHTFDDIGCSRQRLLAAANHMHEIRKRPTVVDLAWMLGILPGAADDIIDAWLTG
ncbi:MAG: iron-containing alcohol dehydrogenase [Planctomycetota bacterium]